MSEKMVEDKLERISAKLEKLEKEPGFLNAKKSIDAIAKELLGIKGEWEPFSDTRSRIKQKASWFNAAHGFKDRRATYRIIKRDENDNRLDTKNIDLKAYWVKNKRKATLSWVAALTPNFEDEPFYTKKNVGIDFIIPNETDRILIILSNNYILRILEIKGRLGSTHKEILGKWLDLNFQDKKQLHKGLWDSFDLQPINKSFYEKIRYLFCELRQHLHDNNIFSSEKIASVFVMRLLGRIMFCWFLNKKGFIRDGEDYLCPKDSQSDEDYYYNTLGTLFFDILDTPRRDREKRFRNTAPYLNGGLFSKNNTEDYVNDIFAKSLRFPKDFFKKFYDCLKSYNFTTDESASTYQQVAIDPEMLGKIFENLLAEQRDETEKHARQARGTYYTPREIVDYMCKESLREYLKSKLPKTDDVTELLDKLLDKKLHEFVDQRGNYQRDMKKYKEPILKALEEIRVLDPACGSGAFPMGMLQAILNIYERIETNGLKQKKLEIVKNNIYGVDIEPMAIEFSKLRVWLSLIIDHKPNGTELPSLPNLEFKFVCANSLIDLKDKNIVATKELEELRDNYFHFDARNSRNGKFKKKKAIKEELDFIRLSKSQKRFNPFDLSKHCNFFNPEIMFGIRDGFDVVIGNPPYIKEPNNKDAFDGLRESPYYKGKMDIWYFFACKGLDISRENSGIITLIAQNNWVTSFGASEMRKKVIIDSQILNLIDFGDFKIFDAGIQTMIMMFQKSINLDRYNFDYRKLSGKTLGLKDVIAILSKEENPNAEYLNPKIERKSFFYEELETLRKQKNLKRTKELKKLTFSDPQIEKILNKFLSKRNFKLLEEEVGKAIEYNMDCVKQKHLAALGNKHKIGDGIFVISGEEKNQLSLTEGESTLAKPYYTTRELFKWYGNPKNKEWIIYTDSSFKDKNKIKDYPNIKRHLDQFTKVITSDNKPYGLHRARKESFFKDEKIIAVRKCAIPTFTYADFDSYVSAAFYVIKTGRINQKYLTGVLNSKLIAFWLKHRGKMQGSNYQIDKEPIVAIPIFKASESKQKPLVDLTNEILLNAKKNNYSKDFEKSEIFNKIQQKIDQLVYDLYGLTNQEIGVIEKSRLG